MLGADAFVSMPVFDAPQLIAEIKKLLPLVPALEADRLEEENGKSDNGITNGAHSDEMT